LWLTKNIRDISVKMHEMEHIGAVLHPRTGPVLIYSANVLTGVRPNVFFYRANGSKMWEPGKVSKGKELDIPRMVNISGTVSLGGVREAIKILKSDSNYNGNIIRYVHASPKIRTGVTLRHFGVVIVNEVGWTCCDTGFFIIGGFFFFNFLLFCQNN
jgi:hypothetical protein